MKIVKRGDKYAIRKWSWSEFRFLYKDLKVTWFWWAEPDSFFFDCWGPLEQVENRVKTLVILQKDEVVRDLC